MPESRNAKSSSFDFFGFGMLAVAIASFQLLLDRGQLLDWFSSTEIVIEAVAASLALYLFIVHVFSTKHPFLNPALFKDRNFVTSTVFIFLIGVVLFATLALLPPMLQNQLQYPVVLTGLVTAPRGFGTLASMLIVGRLIGRFDARLIMTVGLLLMAYSLWQMTQYSLLMNYWPVVWSRGFSRAWPSALFTFRCQPWPSQRCRRRCATRVRRFSICYAMLEARSGFSVVMFLLTQNTQQVHAALAAM